jgi:hypothetical protein
LTEKGSDEEAGKSAPALDTVIVACVTDARSAAGICAESAVALVSVVGRAAPFQ